MTSAFACAPGSERFYVPWPEEQPEISFFLHSDGERVREIRGPYSTTAEPSERFEFEEIEGLDGFLLGFELEALRAAMPRLPSGLDPNTLRLENTSESCAGGRYERSEDGHFRYLASESFAHRIWGLGVDDERWAPTTDSTLASFLRLRAPEDPDRCGPSELSKTYRAFAAEEAWLEGVETLGGQPLPTRPPLFGVVDDEFFLQGAWVNPNLVVAATRNGVFRIERGSRFEDHARVYRPISEELDALMGMDGFMIETLKLDPRSYSDGRSRLLFIANSADIPGRPIVNLLGRIALDEDGFSAPEVLWSGDRRLRTVVFEEDGRGLVVGHGGTVLVLDPDPSVPPEEMQFQGGVPWLTNIELTGVAETPHLVTTEQNSFFLGDIATGLGEMLAPPGSLSGTPSNTSHHWTENGPRILSSLYLAGLIQYRADHGWTRTGFALPNHIGECATLADECGRAQPPGIAYGLHAHRDGWFLASMSECEAIFLLDVDAECGRVILPPGAPVARTTEAGFVRRLDVRDGRALIVGSKGRLIEVELP